MNENNFDHYIETIFEVREGTDKTPYIQGYALTFDSMSEDMGFREVIRAGALDDTDLSDVILNFNHSNSTVLARNNKADGVGSLKISVDEKGLFFEGCPTDTSYSRDLLENIRQGVINKCSFRFRLDYNDRDAYVWDWDETGERGYDIRYINKIKKISDVSLVTIPAYNSTTASTYVRAKENQEQELNIEKEKEKLRVLLG